MQQTTSKLPIGVTFEDAASSIFNVAAVSSALSIHMKLQCPILEYPSNAQDSTILIYGGSGSAGGFAVCYARAAGYRVVTTSSLKHKDYVQHLGPIAVNDHDQPRERIVKDVELYGPYDVIFNAFGPPIAVGVLGECIYASGVETFYTLDMPERTLLVDVKATAPYSLWMEKPEHHNFRIWFYTELVPKGLQSDTIVPTRPQWPEGGLSHVQTGLNAMMDGQVSGAKVLLDPSSL